MKHVACGKNRLAIGVKLYITSQKISITTNDFLFFRIPNYQLFVTVLTSVKLIKIYRLTCTTASLTKDDFPESTYFL